MGEGATIVEYVKIVFSNIGYFDRAPDWVGGGGSACIDDNSKMIFLISE